MGFYRTNYEKVSDKIDKIKSKMLSEFQDVLRSQKGVLQLIAEDSSNSKYIKNNASSKVKTKPLGGTTTGKITHKLSSLDTRMLSQFRKIKKNQKLMMNLLLSKKGNNAPKSSVGSLESVLFVKTNRQSPKASSKKASNKKASNKKSSSTKTNTLNDEVVIESIQMPSSTLRRSKRLRK